MAAGWEPRPSDVDADEWRPALDVPPPDRQRRWTVFLRWLLLLPQFIVVALLSIAAFFVTIAGWFAALFLGRLPDPIASFLGTVLAYQTRVSASSTLLVDRYPPFAFDAPEYPVQIGLQSTPLNRLAVFFRLILVIPAAIISGLAQSGWFAISWVFWLIGIILGRLPEPVFGATAAVVRYRMRLSAYMMLLTPVYPKGILGDAPPPAAEQPYSATRPLVLGTPAKVLVWVFLVLGLAGNLTSGSVDYDSDKDHDDYKGRGGPAAVVRVVR
ncbi:MULTISPECIES: DUF4389 domain-containing protein [Streptomyces]|uniref:DUF4389 domain-containing protein n=1 Tax=Streptomyces solicathayae TaxID=3081768 RepID=A0ABZ0M4U0_9ACTN|nr:DUF4389 domain-containing protein [Streptomyces sp. HUAS YS2]WOX26451.1 DUF4389 domain-containing protein [Streptomyces sp. HUAS YS2]